MNPGFFVSLDGLDGTGKSTQCRLLADWLRGQGRPVTTCVDPGGTPLGGQLRRILLDERGNLALPCEALLFMASRAQLVAEVIRPALASGYIVVSDRYVLANLVYQGHAGGLDPELLRLAGRLSTDGCEPDLTVVLDLPLEVSLTRRKGQADRLESRDRAYHEKVRQGFLTEAARRPDRIQIVDASGPVPTVQAAIQQCLRPLLPTISA